LADQRTIPATGAHLCKAQAPNHVLFHAGLVFVVTGALLSSWPVALLTTIRHLVGWIRKR
jgi:hypothetical protein